ncbi:MAG: RNA polymerase sigma factor RpoD/SigA [bacterium]|nr:RNA polymerase sigma factor RpoD/SigA [bacterium]
MALPKLFSRTSRKAVSPILIEDLDRNLDVDTDRFPAVAKRLARQFTKHRAVLDLAGYRTSRLQAAAETAGGDWTAGAAARSGRGGSYAVEIRRLLPMDREEEFRMARRHEFVQRMVIQGLTAFGITEEDATQLVRRPTPEMRAAIAGRKPKGGLDVAWFDGLLEQFEDLRNLYVEGALQIVLGTVHRYRGLGVDSADLIQEGNASLFQAIDGFDWRRDVRFRTYAQFWVQQAVLKMLYNNARTVRVPIWVQKVLGKIRRAQEAGRRDGRELTHEELAEQLDISVEKVQWVLESRRHAVSLDAEAAGQEGASLGSMLPDDNLEPIPESISPGDLGATLEEAMADLPDRERHILRSRFGLDGDEPRTLGEIAVDYSITPERVRQLQNAALARLKKPAKLNQLKAFVE